MRQFLLSAIFLMTAGASVWAQTTVVDNGADPVVTFGACTTGNSVIIANKCAGATLGIKVNAADAMLGNNPGEIWVYGGGVWGDENSRSTISSTHILRLFPGTYTSTGTFGYILLKDDSALICQDPATTILQQPTHAAAPKIDVSSIVKVFGQSGNPQLFVPNRHISVKGCRFKGARSDFHTGQAVVEMGNCHNCEVSGNVFENLSSIAVAYGSPATLGTDPLSLGKYAEGSSIHHNTFIHCNAVNAAMTNGQNIVINDNIFLRPGYARGGFPIAVDIEPNSASDRAVAISILDNIIDFHGAETIGDGITVSNYPAISPTLFGQIIISGNTFRGGLDSTAAGSRQLRGALLVKSGVYDVTFTNNVIRFARASAIYVNGTRIHVEGNSIFGNGIAAGGYYPILFDTASSESSAVNNRIYCNLDLTKACSTPLQNKGASSNSISDNLLIGP
jgi:hypothetical protein